MADTTPNLATLEKKVDIGFARLEGRMDTEAARNEERFGRIDERFGEVDARFSRIDERFGEVSERFGGVDERSGRIEATLKDGFDRMDAKFDALYRLIIQVAGGLIGTLVAAVAAFLITHA